MKKSELKQMIKEAVKEVILEEGFLSTIIVECMRGVTAGQVQLVEKQQQQPQQRSQPMGLGQMEPQQRPQKSDLAESRKKLLDAVGLSAYNDVDVFEGTQPLVESQKVAVPGAEGQAQGPLAGIAPHDRGIDLSIFGNAFRGKEKG